MSRLEGWVQRRLAALLLWMLAGGFAMLLAELLLTTHTDGVQLVGIVASGVGLVLTLAALAVGRHARYGVAVLLLLLSVTGLLGVYQHYEARSGEEAATPAYLAHTPAAQTIALRAQDDGNRVEPGEDAKGTPPPLAPLSLSGLSLMAAVVALSSGKPRT